MKISLKKIYNIKNHPSFIIFLISFLCILFFTTFINQQELYADANYYDSLSGAFIQNGSFSFYNYPSTYRGIVFPFILFIFKQFAVFLHLGEPFGWRLLISFLVAGITTSLPKLFIQISNKNVNFFRRLAPLLCILIFWYGLCIYPLSDMVSIAFLILGLSILCPVINSNISLSKIILCSILSGVSFYIAYNTRTIYLFPLIIGIPLLAILNFKSMGRKKCLILIAGVLIGVFLIGSLQALINNYYHNSFTIAVMSENLLSWQLTIGMTYSQYETYIHTFGPEQYPSAALKFVDPVGTYIFNAEGLDSSNPLSIFSMMRLILKYPLEFVGIYTRHFINMLNPVWGGGAYIKDLYKTKIHLSILNYSMLFLCVKSVIIQRTKLKKGWNYSLICLLILLIPCIFILPGAVEIRFFLPMYFVLYGLLFYISDFKKLWWSIRRRPILNIAAFAAIYAGLSAVWGATYASTEFGKVFWLL